MPRPIVKNTCTWITSDDSPAGIPSFMPRNSRPNWNTPIASPYAMTTLDGMRGRRMKNTSGTAANRNRNAASANGGTSTSPTLIGTNEKPQSATTTRISARSRGASRGAKVKSGMRTAGDAPAVHVQR